MGGEEKRKGEKGEKKWGKNGKEKGGGKSQIKRVEKKEN